MLRYCLQRPLGIELYARPPIKRAVWWPAKLGNTSTAFLYRPVDTRFHQKPPTFRSEGIWIRRGAGVGQMRATGRAGTTMKHGSAAWRSMAVFHPSGISALDAIRTDGRTADPAGRRLFTSRAAQSDKFTPSVRESQRPVVPYAGAARVKIKANLSRVLCYQFPATCRPDVGVYHPPRRTYRMFRTISHRS